MVQEKEMRAVVPCLLSSPKVKDAQKTNGGENSRCQRNDRPDRGSANDFPDFPDHLCALQYGFSLRRRRVWKSSAKRVFLFFERIIALY